VILLTLCCHTTLYLPTGMQEFGSVGLLSNSWDSPYSGWIQVQWHTLRGWKTIIFFTSFGPDIWAEIKPIFVAQHRINHTWNWKQINLHREYIKLGEVEKKGKKKKKLKILNNRKLILLLIYIHYVQNYSSCCYEPNVVWRRRLHIYSTL